MANKKIIHVIFLGLASLIIGFFVASVFVWVSLDFVCEPSRRGMDALGCSLGWMVLGTPTFTFIISLLLFFIFHKRSSTKQERTVKITDFIPLIFFIVFIIIVVFFTEETLDFLRVLGTRISNLL